MVERLWRGLFCADGGLLFQTAAVPAACSGGLNFRNIYIKHFRFEKQAYGEPMQANRM